jgi:hypothetical protein
MNNKFRNSLLIIGLLSAISVSLSSCKKNDGIVRTNQAVLFVNADAPANYVILNEPNSVFKIPLGLTNIPDKDVTIQFTVSSPSGATQGQQYNLASNSVTIPAGTTVDTIELKGLFNGFSGGRRDTLIFTLTSGDVPIVSGANKYTVTMQQYCPLDMNDFAGNFTVIQDDWLDYAPGDVIPLTVSKDTIFFYYNNIPNANQKPIKILVDKNTFATSVATQTYGDYDFGGPIFTVTCKSVASPTNVVVPCDKKVTITLNHSIPGVQDFGDATIVLQKL